MKKLLIALLATISFSGIMAQQQKEINTQIERVMLFPDRAQVFHTAEFSIPPGNTTLVIKGLSTFLIPETVRAEGVGDFMIMSVNRVTNYLESPEESPEVAGLRKQIDGLQIKIEDELVKIEILKEKEAFLVANRQITGREQGMNSAEYNLMTEQYVKGIESVRTGILISNRILKALDEEKKKLENQLNGATSRASQPSNEILVSVSSEGNIRGKLSLSYLVLNAGWYPSYDIRVSGTDSPAAIFYKANTWQNTGIDWKNVLLSFSSARPSVSGNIPQLYPWYIDFYQESIRIRGNASLAAPAKMEMAIEESDYEPEKDLAAVSPPVRITESGTSFSFNLDIKQDLETGGKISVIELQRLTAPAYYSYKAIPKIMEEAFLTADIPDWESLNLIDGEANIYFGNTFTGKSIIRQSQLSDTMNISLGNDAGIVVKREKRTDYTETRMIGSNRQETRSYLISVRNNRPGRVTISILDQVPLSGNNQISVEATELSGGTLDKIKGEVKWELELAPGQYEERIITYTVKYPKNQKVIIEN